MSDVILDIKRWGNNLGVRMPAAIVRAAKLRVDQRVRLTVENGAVVMRPQEEAMPTLEQRLARYDASRHGGEVMVAERVGVERW
jgi:antitoxin MazE